MREHTRGRSLFTRADTETAELALLERLEREPPGTLLTVDFSGVRISSEAARQLLRRAILRITGGELTERFLVLGDLGESRYNVEVMLAGESLVAVERSKDEGAKARGAVDPAVRTTYDYLASKPTATASMVLNDLGLSAIAAATNRLSNLAKLGLARRVEQRPVSGGGREYVYAAVQ
ncbi:hypothetical protein [Longimicrobium terrae]|uniref:Uncharacterized protein n=1 Tax=Longimicrobium terrae TaxID=1639882 RepID=A0A841GUD7_9BACT|nr:hypothetical protein [Longimicrobium terrae]MBB4635973.1 hypothetical protein [Longimicrobium terrae]MBB6070369.1 hypothetical protein [Longimicrobium terrae]NNC30866.1 hypothetical protein [Longimicrobium terrae]